ncbi:hypothetical protein RZS08_25910, partial [Arthrospira platensis SPKY1]|nr:hypothetical protein [Arthrospira platensis SPKY1]
QVGGGGGDYRQRRAELVRHHGQELALLELRMAFVAQRALELVVGVLQGGGTLLDAILQVLAPGLGGAQPLGLQAVEFLLLYAQLMHAGEQDCDHQPKHGVLPQVEQRQRHRDDGK